MRARIISPWSVVGSVNDPMAVDPIRYCPKLAVDYPSIDWRDVTGEPSPVNTPSPNPLIVEVICDQSTLDAIAADPAYGEGAILWSEA